MAWARVGCKDRLWSCRNIDLSDGPGECLHVHRDQHGVSCQLLERQPVDARHDPDVIADLDLVLPDERSGGVLEQVDLPGPMREAEDRTAYHRRLVCLDVDR